MTTLCLEDLSERDFATLSRLPRRDQQNINRRPAGIAERRFATTSLSEPALTPDTPARIGTLHSAGEW